MIGQTISHYKITGKIGEWGMGVVYTAEDTKLNRTVALKFIHPHLITYELLKKRFLREAQLASSLTIPTSATSMRSMKRRTAVCFSAWPTTAADL
jgi:serine/threonine protein kinase